MNNFFLKIEFFILEYKSIPMIKISQFLSSVFLVLLCAVSGHAQVKLPKVLAFGNFTYASPGNDLKSLYTNGTGFEIGGGIGMGKTIYIVSTGLVSYKASGENPYGNLKVTPIKIGVRRYLVLGLFVNANVGLAVQKYDNSDMDGSKLLYEVGAGIKMLGAIEIGAAYTGWSMTGMSGNASALLFKAGIALKF